jgi:Na+/proline symporter
MAARQPTCTLLLSLAPAVILLLLSFSAECTSSEAVPPSKSHCPLQATSVGTNQTFSKVYPVLNNHQAAALLLIGFGGLSVLLALLYVAIRKHVFHDADNLDTTFDAGGKVSTSLTAVTVASQLLWPGDLLQCATVAIKNGIAGSFWYTSCAVVNMILFPVLSVQFKTRAPGAKTFLQIIHARFGDLAHVVFCFFALLMNLMVTFCLLTASIALLQALVKDASGEYCVIIMATLFGSYSFVGGLGSTFYVSYFNTVIIFACVLCFTFSIFYDGEDAGTFNAIDSMYDKVRCLDGPEKNEDRSYITFWSEGAIIWAVQGFFATASITFCDQASWQSRIAAKPVQGVLGFFAATYIWFAIPSTIGTTLGLGYLARTSSPNSTFALDADDIDQGLVTVFMAQYEMGLTGSYLILTMLIMAVMSSGSGEVMAISSIIVYDIYQTHVRPFRHRSSVGSCALCGEVKQTENGSEAEMQTKTSTGIKYCQCPLVSECSHCVEDLRKVNLPNGKNRQRIYLCPFHGDYRSYLDGLVNFKSWCILWVTIGLLPVGMVILASGVDLNYVMVCGFILTTPSFPPALMTILWSKTSSAGVIVGSISGLVGGIAANLITASTLEGGLDDFLKNTSKDYPVLAGSTTSFGLSLILTIVVSLLTNKVKNKKDELVEWQKARDIDNPLKPWSELFKDDFPALRGSEKPSYDELDKVFRTAKLTAYIGGAISLVLFIVIIPGSMASLHVLGKSEFRTWVIILQGWAFLMAAVVIVVVPVEEILVIFRQIRLNMKTSARAAYQADGKGSNSIQDDGAGVGLVPLSSDPNAVTA